MRQGLEIRKVRAAGEVNIKLLDAIILDPYLSKALRSLLKSECFGLSTSTIPHG